MRSLPPRTVVVSAALVLLTTAPASAITGHWLRVADGSPVAPAPRMGHTLVMDPPRQRVLAFGGYGYSLPWYDLWALGTPPPRTWAPLYVPGTIPAGRLQAAMARDPVSGRFVLFGGKSLGNYFGDVWALDTQGNLATWTKLVSASGPGPRETVALTDSVRDRILIYGGLGSEAWYDELWSLQLAGDHAVWSQLPVEGERPGARVGYTVVLDPRWDRLVLYGGHHSVYLSDVWILPLSEWPYRWTRVYPAAGTGPGPRYGHVAGYDPEHERMIVFGGYNGAFLADAWVLDLSGEPRWEPVHVTGPSPAPRDFAAAVWDAPRGRMLVYGGNTDGGAFGDAWELVLGDEALASEPAAGALAFAGATPNPAHADVWLSFTLPAAGAARLRLFDLAGRVCADHAASFAAGPQRVCLAPRHALVPGLYLAELRAAGERRVARVMVTR